MTTRQITPPAALAVSLAAARTAARADNTDLDAEITQQVKTFTEAAEHGTGRALITQAWRMTLDAFPVEIDLTPSPLQSVTSVKYYDANGVQQTLAPTAYIVDSESRPARLVPVTAWPTTAARINAVQIDYMCGYGDDDSKVPDSIKGYILARVQQHFAPVSTAKESDFEGLLDRERVYR